MIYIGVREPHTDRFVVSLSVDHLLDKDSHKEILRYDELSLYTGKNVFLLVNGTTLTYVHGVCIIEFESVQVVLHLDPKPFIFMVGMAAIEYFVLGLHVGKVVRLISCI